MEAPLKLVIKSSEWWRGEKSLLCNGMQDKFCCMGIQCRDIYGVSTRNLANTGLPTFLGSVLSNDLRNKFFKDGATNYSSFQRMVAEINDDPMTTDEEKIEQLRPYFKEVFNLEIDWRPNE